MGSALGDPCRGVERPRSLAAFAIICALLLLRVEPAAAQAKASGISISQIESFDVGSLAGVSSAGASFKPAAGAAFNAYGRRFELKLEANDRIASPAILAKAGSLQLLRGSIDNAPGSWVRLATVDGSVRGMLWDGSQLYMIEPAAAVRDMLVPPLVVAPGETVIFRLADTSIDAIDMHGDSLAAPGASSRSGQQAYTELLQELKGSSLGGSAGQQAAGATKRLQISTIGDALFRNQYASATQATNEILVRMNFVDGIFSNQLNVAIQAASVNVTDAITAALATDTDVDALLPSLAALRNNSSELNSRGLTHLFTGRNLVKGSDPGPVGIAYTDTLCSKNFGVGLTESRTGVGRSAGFEALFTAHEIGHNFGAVHDGDSGAATCPAGPNLMSPSIAQNADTFSSCSLAAMRPKIQAASCITALPPADLALSKDLGTLHQPLGQLFSVIVAVTNSGGLTATGATVQIVIPPSLYIDEASVTGGSCTSGAGTIVCTLNPVDGGATQQIELKLRGDIVGSNSISAQLTAPGDSQTANNSGDGTIIIDPKVDLSLALQGPGTGTTNSGFVTNFTVANLGSSASGTAFVEFTVPVGASATAAAVGGSSCTVNSNPVRCTVASIAANSSLSGSISLTAPVTGTLRLTAKLTGTTGDENAANDTAEVTVIVTAPAPVRKGGGGDFSLLLLIALSAVATVRWQSSRKATAC